MKIILELYNTEYSVETQNSGYSADELKEIFSRMMVVAGYPPGVIEDGEGGHYEYLGDGEIIIKKEK